MTQLMVGRHRGFTLLEMVLYLGLVALSIGAMVFFMWILFDAETKHQVMSEVEQQGVQIMQIITKNIENTRIVKTPERNANPSTTLVMDMGGSSLPEDQVVFDVDNGVMRQTTGSHAPVMLNNDRVEITAASFQDLANDGAHNAIVRVIFTLRYKNPAQRALYHYEQTFYGSASVRE